MYTKKFKLKHVVKNCHEPVRENTEIELLFGVPWNLHRWRSSDTWESVFKNYVVNDCLTVECHVTIKKMTGFIPKRKINFEPRNNLTDVVLKVAEKMFNVNKTQLAFRSTYFDTLFFGPFDDSKKPEIEEVKPDDFQCLLEAIYGESSVIQPKKVEGVMKLADQFDVKSVRDEEKEKTISRK